MTPEVAVERATTLSASGPHSLLPVARGLALPVRVPGTAPPADIPVVDFAALKAILRDGAPWRWAGALGSIELRTYQWETLSRPFATAVLLRCLSRGDLRVRDDSGIVRWLDPTEIVALAGRYLWDAVRRPFFLARRRSELVRFEKAPASPSVRGDGRPLSIRADAWFGIVAGGSVAHISGVLNALTALGHAPRFLTTDRVPTVHESIETRVVEPPPAFRDFPRLYGLACDEVIAAEGARWIDEERPDFIYARHAVQSFASGQLARTHSLPLVLEYNGSEVWVEKHWGDARTTSPLAEEIEAAQLRAADLVVVVSEPLRADLLARGVPDTRILVNPNGVDVSRYRPDVDGSGIRRRLGLDGCVVLGFVGTFGRWHGAEVLTEAFARLTRDERHANCRLLMIGDGEMRAEAERRARAGGALERTRFVGRVPQAETVEYLAACDALISPHVPNPDGTEFFGSPTKLFEYLAMGKPIVASRLAQLGDVLEHDVTAILCEPGDSRALAAGIASVLDHPERAHRLALNARCVAVERHAWEHHTRRILDRLTDLVGPPQRT